MGKERRVFHLTPSETTGPTPASLWKLLFLCLSFSCVRWGREGGQAGGAVHTVRSTLMKRDADPHWGFATCTEIAQRVRLTQVVV